MTEVSRRKMDATASAAQWGTKGETVTELVLSTSGTPFGVRVLAFDPVSPVVVRDRTRGFDADAPKVIDFYAPDFAAARATIERAGWKLVEPVAEYDLEGGHFIEGHVWGPDEIVCAPISGPPEFFKRFATVTDRPFSEPQSLSGAVTELEPIVDFFTRAFDLRVVNRYGIEDEGFKKMVGTDKPQFNLRAVNVGLTTEQPYLGLIHYGMAPGSFTSLKGRARPPHRGTLGATVVVRNVDEVVRRAVTHGATLLAAPTTAEVGAFGRTRCALLAAPNGGCYQVVAG
jgi:catechol 2,3-dioxygenase-like lactoylglutathione lyase family enzyme